MAAPLVPSKDALRALRSIVFSTPSAVVSVVGGVCCVANLHHDVGQRIRHAEKILETKRAIRSVSSGQGASRIAQLFEAAERGEDFLLQKGAHRAPKQARVYSTQAQAVVEEANDYIPAQPLREINERKQQSSRVFNKSLPGPLIRRHVTEPPLIRTTAGIPPVTSMANGSSSSRQLASNKDDHFLTRRLVRTAPKDGTPTQVRSPPNPQHTSSPVSYPPQATQEYSREDDNDSLDGGLRLIQAQSGDSRRLFVVHDEPPSSLQHKARSARTPPPAPQADRFEDKVTPSDGLLGLIQGQADDFKPFFLFQDDQLAAESTSRSQTSTSGRKAGDSRQSEAEYQSDTSKGVLEAVQHCTDGSQPFLALHEHDPLQELLQGPSVSPVQHKGAKQPQTHELRPEKLQAASDKIMLATQKQHKPSDQKAFSRPTMNDVSGDHERRKDAIGRIMIATQQQHQPTELGGATHAPTEPGTTTPTVPVPVDRWLKAVPKVAPVTRKSQRSPTIGIHKVTSQEQRVAVSSAGGKTLLTQFPSQIHSHEKRLFRPKGMEWQSSARDVDEQGVVPNASHEAAENAFGFFNAGVIFANLKSHSEYDRNLESIVGFVSVAKYIREIRRDRRTLGFAAAVATGRKIIEKSAIRDDKIGWATIDLLYGLYTRCHLPVFLLSTTSPIWHKLVRQLMREVPDPKPLRNDEAVQSSDAERAQDEEVAMSASSSQLQKQDRVAHILFPQHGPTTKLSPMRPKYNLSAPYLTKFYEDHSHPDIRVAETRKVLAAARTQGYKDEEIFVPLLRESCYNGHLDNAETLYRVLIEESGTSITLSSIDMLLSAYAVNHDWNRARSLLEDYHHAGLSRTKPYSYAAVFANLLEHFVKDNSPYQSYNFAVDAVENLGLLPQRSITSILFARFIQTFRPELIEKWLSFTSARFPALIPVTMSGSASWRIGQAWKIMEADCRTVDINCRAMAFGSTRKVFSNSFKGIVRDVIEADLHKKIERGRNMLIMNGVVPKAHVTPHSDLDALMNAAYEVLMISQQVYIRPSDKDAIDDLKSQLRSIACLNKLFGGHLITIDEKLQSGMENDRELGRTQFERKPLEYRAAGLLRNVVEHVKDPSLLDNSVPEALKQFRLPPEQEVINHLEGYYKERAIQRMPVDHFALEVTAQRMAELGHHHGAIELLSYFHSSRWVQGVQATKFHLNLYSAWLQFATQIESYVWIGKILWSILNYARHLRLDTHFLLQIKSAQLKVLRHARINLPRDHKERLYEEFLYLRWRFSFNRWQQRGGHEKRAGLVPKLSNFRNWEMELYDNEL